MSIHYQSLGLKIFCLACCFFFALMCKINGDAATGHVYIAATFIINCIPHEARASK